MRNTNQGPFEIQFPTEVVVVDRYTADSFGVTYAQDGCDVFVPWHRVDAIVRLPEGYEQPDQVPVSDDVAAVEPDPDDTEGDGDQGDSGSSGAEAKEWADNADTTTVRQWAQDQGLEVSASGPISKAVRSAFAAAHSD